MTLVLDRRTFLRTCGRAAAGLTIGGLGLSGVLAACGDDTPRSDSPPYLGALDYHLPSLDLTDPRFAGQQVAGERGYYTAEGFRKVALLTGGSAEGAVASGRALVGISSADRVAAAIREGAPLVVIGAQLQRAPFRILSLPDRPITTPAELVGKLIAVPAADEATWSAFLAANRLDPSAITRVPAGDGPQPLVDPAVDGWFGVVGEGSPAVATVSMLLDDFGLPMVANVYVARRDSLTVKRPHLRAVLRADVKGWAEAIGGPGALTFSAPPDMARLDVTTLDVASLVATDEARANGLFTVTEARIDQTLSTLALLGVTIGREELFDLSVLGEVLDADPALRTLPS